MRNIVLISSFFLLSTSLCFGQLRQIIDAIAESGSIVFTSDINTATKRKDVKVQKSFDANENIYGTIYMKQKFERLHTYEKNGIESVRLSFILVEDKNKSFYWSMPIKENEKTARSLCFEIIPAELNIKNPNHLSFLDVVEQLENKKYEFLIFISQRDGVSGKLTLDLTKGKGKYKAVFDDLAIEKERIAAEKEAARIIAEKERAIRAAARQKVIDTYEASTDFVEVTFNNTSYQSLTGQLSTANSVTDKDFSIDSRSGVKIRCRPNEKIYISNKLVLEVTEFSKGKVFDVSPPPIVFSSMETQWSSRDDAWKSWNIKTNDKNWTMSTQWSSRDDAWKSWNIKANDQNWSVNTQWSSRDDAWKSWSFKTKDETMTMETQWSSRDDAWKSWTIKSKHGNLTVETQWSSRDDAWKSWTIKSKHGTITIETQWSSRDDAWKSWTITDKMEKAPPQAKMAAIFCCIMSGILPYSSTKASCAYNGHKLFGKVKFVDYNEDIKIKYVDYNEDIKVEFVSSSPNDCGEWQVVESSEDLKVKIVDYNEDIKVKKVSNNPGVK